MRKKLEYVNGVSQTGFFVTWLRGGGGVGRGDWRWKGWGGVGEGSGRLGFQDFENPIRKNPLTYPRKKKPE